jgi:dethiobiotin synthase
MTVLFVTGTDTGVGKTVVTAALAAGALAGGCSVCVVKPAQTGVRADEPGDVDEVLRLAGDLDVVEVVRLEAPLAPATAARVAGRGLPSLAEQVSTVAASATDHDLVLVEGAGGALVRLGDDFGLLDIARGVTSLSPEVVVVARSGLGSLNHAALTVEATVRRGVVVCGLVIGSWPADPRQADEHNRQDLPSYTGVPLLGAVPEAAAELDPASFRSAAAGWIGDVLRHVR